MQVTLIQIDETEYWELDALPHGEHIEKMFGTYLFETEVNTYVCSSVPMKLMRWLRDEPIMSNSFEEEVENPDCAIDELHNEMGGMHSDDIYMKHYFIKDYAKKHPDRVFVDDKEYEDWNDAIMSHSENHML